MRIDDSVLKSNERAIFGLRSLYRSYGYSQYKMSKFEEYDLYVRNKSFLVSDNIITFTDTNGKLMALKPDVTLSIIKNSEDTSGGVQRVYYDENVYRVSQTSKFFKEIMQVGLECIGDVDVYSIYEVIMLAAKSLEKISEDFVLDISHLGIVSAVIDSMKVGSEARAALLKCLEEKNKHSIIEICEKEGAEPERLLKLVAAYGSPKAVISVLKDICQNKRAVCELETVCALLEENDFGSRIRIDFSVINDMKYYNGFVFKGFINGISSGILSGGQYDGLMEKMGKKAKAIGFAVYIDLIERLGGAESLFDIDTVILYDNSCEPQAVKAAVKSVRDEGKSVTVQKVKPEKIKYRRLMKLSKKGLETVENNA